MRPRATAAQTLLARLRHASGDDEFARVIDTHVRGAFALARAAAPGMIERRHGSILFISSMTAFMGMPLVVAYSAAKSAVTGMVYTLSEELSPQGVRVNAIAPGWIDSPMLRKAIDADPERKRRIVSRIQMDGFGHPDDPRIVGPSQCGNNDDLYPCSEQARSFH